MATARFLPRMRIAAGVAFAAVAGLATGTHSFATPASARAEESSRLLAVSFVFRHGARTPVYTTMPGLEMVTWPECHTGRAPNFSYDIPSEPALELDGKPVRPCAVQPHHLSDVSRPPPEAPDEIMEQWSTMLNGARAGQLTDLGCAQAYRLGTELRKFYGAHFLGDRFDPACMTLVSTSTPRCVQSAQFVLAGLFDSVVTVPIGLAEQAEETLYPNGKLSERLGHILQVGRQSWQSSPPPHALQTRAAIREKVSDEAFSASGMDKLNFVRLRDVLVALKAHGLPLLPGLDEELLARVDALATEQIVHMMQGGRGKAGAAEPGGEYEAHRHSMGIFMGQVLDQMEACAAGESAGRLQLFSAHDTTVLPLLMILGVFEPPNQHWPDFASSLAFELHDCSPAGAKADGQGRSEQFGIIVRYNLEDITARIPGCPAHAPCSLAAFRQAICHSLPGADGDTAADKQDPTRPVLLGTKGMGNGGGGTQF
ncbi:histidine phosphatase superfamily [Pavlovales sp. CCMP2436]|nr:histidine phosphatase superfamily [Pavlovales sp. CCMP2436]